MSETKPTNTAVPPGVTAALVLADGTVFWGQGLGAAGETVGEVCFNTSITGYQEIMTDPSYAGQIVNFTFPHIGNVGANPEDVETVTPAARGCVLRAEVTGPSNWRAAQPFDAWLKVAEPDRHRRRRHAPRHPPHPRIGRAHRRAGPCAGRQAGHRALCKRGPPTGPGSKAWTWRRT